VEATASKAVKILRATQQEVIKFEEPLQNIDAINKGIMECNDQLKSLVAITKRLAGILYRRSK
jgi:hypothetical protein